jgi:hypothetical protein
MSRRLTSAMFVRRFVVMPVAAVVLMLAAPLAVFAQESPVEQAASSRLRVYLDCSNCFDDYLRDEIDWVDFVRQPQDADVHLLSSDADTGSGGRELVLRFVGAGRLQGMDRELRVVSLVNEAESVRRESVLRTVIVGLLGYLAQDGLPSGLDLSVESLGGGQVDAGPDPWNLWVFEVSAGGEFEAEESNRQVQWDGSFAGDRISEAWKISFGVSIDHQRETFDLDEDDPFEVSQRERSLDWFVAKSLGPHWSVGFEGRVESSTFANTKVSSEISPALEYSVFPYQDYATRQLVILYELGFEVVKYYELTLFDKTDESLWSQEIAVRLDQRERWGSLQAGMQWSQYLHDLDKYRLEADGEISLNLARGFSLEMEGSASRIRDQLSLPRRGATPEEVLLELRELQSGYDVSFSVGISYSFGSLFNNVVNPRFDD